MSTSRAHRLFLFYPPNVAPAALALLLLAFVAPVRADRGRDHQAPDLGECQKLKVPQGNELFFHAFGVGVQIYRWNGTSWDFVAPAAVLFADASEDNAVGMHFAGPTWESVGGSKVVGTVIDHCTPDPDAIPWLLLGAASTEGQGLFRHVTYLQRLNTAGGNPPIHPGAFPGAVARVPYTADYFFYHRAHR